MDQSKLGGWSDPDKIFFPYKQNQNNFKKYNYLVLGMNFVI